MNCEYKGGLKVDYSGSLHIKKGNKIDVFVKDEFIPAHIRAELEMAANHRSCDELWKVGKEVTDTIGFKVRID